MIYYGSTTRVYSPEALDFAYEAAHAANEIRNDAMSSTEDTLLQRMRLKAAEGLIATAGLVFSQLETANTEDVAKLETIQLNLGRRPLTTPDDLLEFAHDYGYPTTFARRMWNGFRSHSKHKVTSEQYSPREFNFTDYLRIFKDSQFAINFEPRDEAQRITKIDESFTTIGIDNFDLLVFLQGTQNDRNADIRNFGAKTYDFFEAYCNVVILGEDRQLEDTDTT